MTKEYYLTLESLKLISNELDNEFDIIELNINELSGQNLDQTDMVKEFVSKFKTYLDKNLEYIKITGKSIIDDIIIRLISNYNHYVEVLKERGNEFIEKIELLIQKWVAKIYEFIVKTIPSKMNANNIELILNEISFERTYGLQAGFRAQLTELFEMIAESNFKITTTYIIQK